MVTRHRVPTVFTLYMVDVLCCALGCVILLWFLKLHEAKGHIAEADRQAEAARTTGERLRATEADRDEIRSARDAAGKDRDAARSRVTDLEAEMARLRRDYDTVFVRADAAEKDRDRNLRDRDLARGRLAEADKSLVTLRTEKAAAEDRLAKRLQDQLSMTKELSAARQRGMTLEALLRDKESLAKATAKSADDLAERLRDEEALLRAAKAKVAALETRARDLEKDVNDRRKEVAGADKDVRNLIEANRQLVKEVESRDRQLAASERLVEALRGEKKAVTEEALRVRAASENRFAGIALTGRRVVFLVDMSGSMDLVDEKTTAPNKWPGVRETLAKVMRSLPSLEKYQVILFSDKTQFLLGNEGRWLDYDATSADRVLQAMAAVKPKGSTNMYTAFEAAFRLRGSGLDTIYVLSDGLPNMGPGLPADSSNLREGERSEILSQYVRRTLKTDWNRDTSLQPRVRINTIGFFYESPEVGAFLWALARENDGSFVGMSKP